MDKDEQEFADINAAFTNGIVSSDKEYSTKMNATLDLYLEQMQGVSEEQQQRYRLDYRQRKETFLQECIERNNAIIATRAQRMNVLHDHIRTTSNDLISPFWRIRVLKVAEGLPSYVQCSFLKITIDASSVEALRELLRFFLNTPVETEQGSPIELEVIRVTQEESAIFLKGREVEDRAVYHIDFRFPGQYDLIGHDHVQPAVIGAWVSIGGRFVHRVTHYDREGRPLWHTDHIHGPIPDKYVK